MTENANKHLEPLPGAIEVIQQYGALVERLQSADRVKLGGVELRTLRAGNRAARQIKSRATGKRENRRPAASQSETGERARCGRARIGRS